MSFLNSVLNSIGSKNSPTFAVVPPAQQPQPFPAQTKNAEDRRPNGAEQSKATPNKKRAAEDVLESTREKAAKIDRRPPSASGKSSVTRLPSDGKVNAFSGIPSESTNGGSKKITLEPMPSGKPLAASAASPKASTEPQPPKKEPKKGSYAEIMARAKANQAKTVAVGTISHKPRDKAVLTHKQEIKLRKRAEKERKTGISRNHGTKQPGHSEGVSKVKKNGGTSMKAHSQDPIKKPKPQPTYRGTMNPASETLKAKEKAAAQTRRRENEYADTDDDLDNEDGFEEDDENGYDGEESDDMEAGFSDVEEEEHAAEQAAKKEDIEEARLEAKMKREKEERKRRMEALAKKAKPQRY